MADYISQFTGGEIDARLRKVSELEAEKQDALVSGENIKTVGGQSVLGSGDIPVGDENAVKFTPQTLTDAQKAQARANIDAVSLADIENMDFVTATSLPTASASTMGHIYLIGPDANDNYDRYFTQESGGSYSWVPLGSTQIDLSTYATKAEVDELEAKVTDLQDGETILQQQIDAIQPVVIEGNVTNAPDNEDITATTDNRLKFKDRPATLTNKGYKILRADKTFASQVTDTNTIYEVRYDFNLGGNAFTMPSGCVLRFDGGKIENGTLGLNGVYIDADGKVFNNISVSGIIANSEIHLSWFCEEYEDSADVLHNLIELPVSAIFLDRVSVRLSHPVAFTDESVFRNFRKEIYGLGGGNRYQNETTIAPTNNYSASGYARNSMFYFATSLTETRFHDIRFEGNYSVGYAFYFVGYFTGEIAECNFITFAISAIKITGTEHCYVRGNTCYDSGAFVIAYANSVDETNVLNTSTTLDNDLVVNLFKVLDNYVVSCNYGIIARIGSDITVERNCISYSSCYALYLFGSRNINIITNYFEGCGGGNFWVDYNGKDESQVADQICDHLLNSHKGENNATIVNGWGLPLVIGQTRIRPVVMVDGGSNSGYRCELAFIGNNFSFNNCRTKLSDNLLGISFSKRGADEALALKTCNATIENNFIGKGSGDYSGIPRYFISLNTFSGQMYQTGTYANSGHSLTINSLPECFREVKDWCYWNFPSGYNDKFVIVKNDRPDINYNSITKMAAYNDLTIKDAQEICPFHSVKDGIKFRSLPSAGEMSYIVPVNPTGANKDTELLLFDIYLYNPTNSDVTYTLKGFYRLSTSIISQLNASYYFPEFGNDNSPLTLSAGQVIKYTLAVYPVQLLTVSQYIRYIYFSVHFSNALAVVSDMYSYSLNTTPSLLLNAPEGYDGFGRKISGTTADRPTASSVGAGFTYYDKTLGKMIMSNGTAWVNMDGTALS